MVKLTAVVAAETIASDVSELLGVFSDIVMQ